MDFIPQQFTHVEPGTFNQSSCSPAQPPMGWSGVRIDAPTLITLAPGESVVLPICGYYMVPVLTAMDSPPMTVTVHHLETGLKMVGIASDEGKNEPDEPDPDEQELKPESLRGISTGGYFNIDAQQFLKAPLIPGSYELSVSYAGVQSNVTKVQIALNVVKP